MREVSLQSVSKRFNQHTVVNQVSLTAQAGEFLALLGPSGCGKSTTLRLIAGLESADEGRVMIGGEDVTQRSADQRGVAMVFQNYALFPHLSVAQNITFGLDVRRVDKAERAKRLQEASALLGLDGYLQRKPAELSGGQRQRVALGRAIVAQAPVCLMDEPLSNLDAKLRQQMRSEIRELQQRLGMTMIYVTHDQTEAMTMADRVALLNQGVIAQCDTPQALYEQPASTFVASFIGAPAMNLFAPMDAAAQTREIHGVRPEKIHLTDAAQGLRATVKTVEYLGAETLISCTATARPETTSFTVRLPSGVAARVGDVLGLSWGASDVHRFDRHSGLALTDPHEFVLSPQPHQENLA